MSKWTEDFSNTFKDVNAVKKATRELIKGGSKLALEEYRGAKSIERLKKEIMKK